MIVKDKYEKEHEINLNETNFIIDYTNEFQDIRAEIESSKDIDFKKYQLIYKEKTINVTKEIFFELKKIKEEEKDAMFSEAKIGDRVWDYLLGWGEIKHINEKGYRPLGVHFKNKHITMFYRLDGKIEKDDLNPSIFWNEIKFDIPEEPFNLKRYLRENLKPKKFELEKANYFIYWHHYKKEFCSCYDCQGEDFKKYFEPENFSKVLKMLNEKKITKEQLRQAFKELGWG